MHRWPVSGCAAIVIAIAVALGRGGCALIDAASRAEDDPRLHAAVVTEVHGSSLPYSLTLPSSGWRAFGAETMAEAPDAEVWLRRSDVAAELMIIPRTGVPRDTPLATLEQYAIERLTDTGLEVLTGERWEVARGGHVLRCYGRVPDVGDTEMLFGFWQRFGVAYVVLLTIPPERYEAFLPEAQAILSAFDPGAE